MGAATAFLRLKADKVAEESVIFFSARITTSCSEFYFAATSSNPGAKMMRANAGVRSQVSEAPRVTNGAP